MYATQQQRTSSTRQQAGKTIACVVMAVTILGVGLEATAQHRGPQPRVEQSADGRITADGQVFASWNEYANSAFFRSRGLRCGTNPSYLQVGGPRGGGGADCTYTSTNPDAIYDPTVVKYRIPVVVHVIRQSDGTTGHVSEAMVQSQIDILNEDFLALVGSNGANGTDVQIEFYLATTDPGGSPTNGITYSDNTTWFNDGGSYWDSLAWDTNRYLNIYTNTASGNLGYVPDFPQGGIAGSNEDRVVVLWSAFGLNGPIGWPYNKGRTATHEVGHYLGLQHPFTGGCSSPTACYTTGDLICDTNPEEFPTFGCGDANSCGSPDPFRNYMDYSEDLCLEEFTPEQARRMRCSLEHYRPNLFEADCNNNGIPDADEIAGGAPDCNGNGIPDECEPNDDCNGNGEADICDVADGTSPDCSGNGIPDECEMPPIGAGADCNSNGIPDECDAQGDCNANGVPDECEVPPISAGNDCNGNLIPDDCEPLNDCQANGVPDPCDIEGGFSLDCNGDGIPDDCQLTGNDSNGNGVPDDCDFVDDADGDGVADRVDGCPNDADKTVPGYCGCGKPDTGVYIDSDIDGIFDCADNCPNDVNPFQWDADNDGIGDACDTNRNSGSPPAVPPALGCCGGGGAANVLSFTLLPLMYAGYRRLANRRRGRKRGRN